MKKPKQTKNEKQKQHSAFLLQQAITEATCTLSSESGPTKLLPQEQHSASQPQVATV